MPIITAKNVTNGHIDFSNTRKTTRTAFEQLSPKDKPQQGDLLVTKDGTIGRSAVVNAGQDFCVNQSVAVVWPSSQQLNRGFLRLAVESPAMQKRIHSKARGVAIQHLSITDFGKMPVPLPPFAEQNAIVDRVETHLSILQHANVIASLAEQRAFQLRESILRKAFAGQLLAQDPADEAASILLAQIASRLAKPPALDFADSQTDKHMPIEPVSTLDELLNRLRGLGGSSSPSRLLVACKLEDDVEKFFDLLRAGKKRDRLQVPTGRAGTISVKKNEN
jgi:type I restriction enzyme S subunit